MGSALALARRGLAEGVLPIGAIVAIDNAPVAEAYWQGAAHGILRHPELAVLLEADRLVGPRRSEAVLYTTLEPCLMCMGAAMPFFVGTVVYALESPADGAGTVATQWHPVRGHRRRDESASYGIPSIVAGVRRAEAETLVREYLAGKPVGAEARWAGSLVNSEA